MQLSTVYPKKYARGFVVLCFVVVMQSFIMNSHEVFIHIHQGCFAGTGAIVRLPQCQWSKPDGYGKISQCITTTKHSKAKTVCIFLGIYCTCFRKYSNTFWYFTGMFYMNFRIWLSDNLNTKEFDSTNPLYAPSIEKSTHNMAQFILRVQTIFENIKWQSVKIKSLLQRSYSSMFKGSSLRNSVKSPKFFPVKTCWYHQQTTRESCFSTRLLNGIYMNRIEYSTCYYFSVRFDMIICNMCIWFDE